MFQSLFCWLFSENCDAVFYRTDPVLYHKFVNMVIFRKGKLYSLCSPGNQDYHKIIHFLNFFIKKGQNRRSKILYHDYELKLISIQIQLLQSMTSNCHTFFLKKTAKKCDNLGTFTQKILFLDHNKTKKAKGVTI